MTLKEGFAFLEQQRPGFLANLRVICSDMWKPYLKVIARQAGWALNVLDPFHIAKHLDGAVDEVRRGFAPLADAGRLGCVLVQFPWSFKRDAVGREWLGGTSVLRADWKTRWRTGAGSGG